jgi:hypothetical protein
MQYYFLQVLMMMGTKNLTSVRNAIKEFDLKSVRFKPLEYLIAKI